MTRIATLAIAAAAMLAVPTVVSAAPKAGSDASSSDQPTTVAKPQRYCVVETPTGSRLERRECKTLDAWLAEGFDPRATK